MMWLLLVLASCVAPYEVCDQRDNDGDDLVDEGFDQDGDGWAACAVIATNADCDDLHPEVNPAAAEACDGLDTDCDGVIADHEADLDDDGLLACAGDCDDEDPFANVLDVDRDGYTTCDAIAPDCDDFAPTIRPGVEEACDGLDTDCDGIVPVDEIDGDADGQSICEGDCQDTDPVANTLDADGDGQSSCGDASSWDCDDANGAVWSGAPEVCDGQANDCTTGWPTTPAGEVDVDSDGVMACERDCDDDDPDRNPLLDEGCDGIDNDCDGVVPADELDADGDGEVACAGDCDDADPLAHSADWDGDGYSPCTTTYDCDDGDAAVFPGAVERCNGVDDDCNGGVSTDELDGDRDGYPACEDCDDTNADAWDASAAELCDGFDNNCDGELGDATLSEADADGDGQYACAYPGIPWADCDDHDASVFVGASEACGDTVDSDCDGDPDTYTLYVDDDGDGVGLASSAASVLSCGQAAPACGAWCYVGTFGDCDDTDPALYAGADDVCGNAIDEDCDETTDDHCP